MRIKKIILSLSIGIFLLISVLLFRTFSTSPESAVTLGYEKVELDSEKISQNLSAAITFKTISEQNQADINYAEFTAFIAWLAETYPEVHGKLTLIRINEFTLLYQWQGQDTSMSPVLLSGHYDVVPVIPGTEAVWTHPPFAGVVDETHIWGRGVLDDKSAVI